MTRSEFERALATLARAKHAATDRTNVRCERTIQSTRCMFCSDIERCHACRYCTACTECTECSHCTDSFQLRHCVHCRSCDACVDCSYLERSSGCVDCTYCFGCVGLKGAHFHILNQPVPRSEYFTRVEELRQQGV